jgi:putative membrane protein
MSSLVTSTRVLAQPWDGHHMWGDGSWMWWFGPLVLLAVLAATVAVVWLATHRCGDGTRRAREILGERYARGELSTEEYHDRLEHLR